MTCAHAMRPGSPFLSAGRSSTGEYHNSVGGLPSDRFGIAALAFVQCQLLGLRSPLAERLPFGLQRGHSGV